MARASRVHFPVDGLAWCSSSVLVVYQAIWITYVHKLPNINQEYIYMSRLLACCVGLPDDQNKHGCILTCLLVCILREQ